MEVVAQKLKFDGSDIEDDELNFNCRANSLEFNDDNVHDLSGDFGEESENNIIKGLPKALQPRKLFNAMDCSDDESSTMQNNTKESNTLKVPGGSAMVCSPPYRRVRELHLGNSPETSKTPMDSSVHTPLRTKCTRRISSEKRRSILSNHSDSDKPAVNVNPFTPNGMLITARKRSRSKRSLNSSSPMQKKFELDDSDDSDDDVQQPTKRIALQELNIPRYHQEFHELGLIGTGEFGSVYKCINRLDGCIYAIKKSIKPVAGSVNETKASNEVQAHAVLGKHAHVVRHYSAWVEDDHMIIQNEYCNGGSLADVVANYFDERKNFTEAELRQILLHVAEGLRYIHSLKLSHMDIKPGNIFISKEKRLFPLNYDSADDGYEEEMVEEEKTTYKIGDLGHVTSTDADQVEEGDRRYLPREVLQDDLSHLTKADIFALGLTVYEAGGGGPLPENGPEWQSIRDGNLKELKNYSTDLNELLKLMVHPNPETRPSAVSLVQHRILCPANNGSKKEAELRRELNAEKLKNEFLSKQLEEAAKCIKTFVPSVAVSSANERLRATTNRAFSTRAIGRSVARSNSSINF